MFGQFVFCWASLSTCLNLTTHTHSSATVQCASKGIHHKIHKRFDIYSSDYSAMTNKHLLSCSQQTCGCPFARSAEKPDTVVALLSRTVSTEPPLASSRCNNQVTGPETESLCMAWSLIEEASETWQGWYFDTQNSALWSLEVGLLESKVMFPGFRTNRINRMGSNRKSDCWCCHEGQGACLLTAQCIEEEVASRLDTKRFLWGTSCVVWWWLCGFSGSWPWPPVLPAARSSSTLAGRTLMKIYG